MRTWIETRFDEYGGSYSVSGDKVYVEKVDIDIPLYEFPLYDQMEGVKETWLVYGAAVRAFLCQSFYGGGHHYVFPFIKPAEIWIESNTYPEERPALLLKQTIVRFLMKDLDLTYPEASIVGSAYSLKFQTEQYRTGHLTLKSFYPKKNAYVIDYAPAQRGEFENKKDWDNVELKQFQMALGSLRGRKLDSPEWKNIFDVLDEYEDDLARLPI